jgi:glycosyltransferase involved in cell wall biosynthesis
MRICHITSGHSPDDDRIFYKEARSLTKKYNDVWIVSPYPEQIPRVKDGVNFLFISKPYNKLFGRLETMKRLFNAALSLKADIYHCHEPESFEVATRLKKRLFCKIIFDSHEMWSASIAERFPHVMHNSLNYLYKYYEQKRICEFDYVLGASWAISEYLECIMGSERTETILNGTPEDIFGKVPERKWGEETIVCHEGSLPFSRGLITMVKAVEIVSKKYPVKFKIIGDVFGEERKWLESYVRSNNMDRIIERTGWLDYRDVGPALAHCHIGLSALQKLPNNIVTSANKEFNYMYFGIPFITPDFRLSTNKLITEEKCGLSADSTSHGSYADAIIYMIEHRKETMDMGENARKASELKYSWSHMEKKLLSIYEQIEEMI